VPSCYKTFPNTLTACSFPSPPLPWANALSYIASPWQSEKLAANPFDCLVRPLMMQFREQKCSWYASRWNPAYCSREPCSFSATILLSSRRRTTVQHRLFHPAPVQPGSSVPDFRTPSPGASAHVSLAASRSPQTLIQPYLLSTSCWVMAHVVIIASTDLNYAAGTC
jgi:hypothetical protein